MKPTMSMDGSVEGPSRSRMPVRAALLAGTHIAAAVCLALLYLAWQIRDFGLAADGDIGPWPVIPAFFLATAIIPTAPCAALEAWSTVRGRRM